jgi:hypothetical protein
MSHVVSAQVICTDLDCLRAAVAKFPKLRWMEGKKTYNWYGSWVNDYSRDDAAYKNGIDTSDYGKCEHAIKMDGVEYEIGVMKRKDGAGYSLVWDFFSDGARISEYVGKGAENLMTEYSREFVNQFAAAEGYMMNTSEDETYITMEMTP